MENLTTVHPDEGNCAGSFLRECVYGTGVPVGLILTVPSRRLDDRIRELCARVVSTQGAEMESTIAQLKAALHEHNERLRKLAAAKLAAPRIAA